MIALFCPSPLWDVDDFNQCVKERYLNFWLPILSVLVSIACLFLTSTVRVPAFLRRRWFNKGYRQLPTDGSPIDTESDDENLDPIYRLRTADADAEYDEIDENATNDRDVEDEALDIAPRTRTASNTPANGNADRSTTLILNATPGRRLRSVIEQVVAIALAVVHVVTLFGIILVQYPPFYSERVNLVHTSIASSILSAYILVLSTMRLSPSVRYNSPFLRIHVALFYTFIWSASIVNFRSAIVHSSRHFVTFLCAFDFLSLSVLLVISLLSPVHDRPAYIETVDGLKPNPVPYASIWDTITFSWANKMLKLGYSRPLTMDDVWDLTDDFRSALLMPGYRLAKNGRTMLYGLLKYFRFRLIYGFCFSVMYAIFTFTPTILVRQILRHLEDPSREPTHMAWLYVFLLLVFAFVNATCSAQALWTFRQVCVRTRAIIVAELYSKALKRKVAVNVPEASDNANGKAKLKAKEDQKASDDDANKKKEKIDDETIDLGRVINLMAVDAFSIAEVLARLNPLIKGTMMIFISMVLLYQTLGPSAIAGSLGMLTLLPINYKFSRTFGKIQKELLSITDRRIQKTNEILQSIKIIKFFAWEDRFIDQLQEVRNEEIKTLRKRFLLLAFAAMVWFGFPTIITFITFGFYTMIAKKELTASVAFSALSLFNLMRTPMDRLAEMITNVIEARTSVERVQKFLDEEETQKYTQLSKTRRTHGDPLIGFRGASFAWGAGRTNFDFKLQNIDITFVPGKLSVIVGPTGAGKTSLLMALLGEMNLLKGKVFLPGSSLLEPPAQSRTMGLVESVAYCAQQPWLLNGTIRENILFGNKYHDARYKQVVQLCALVRDFQILEAGDQTPVGEKGISLSGGQKQRISLARALYSNARHLILDDCLSAVDSHTALYLYENCITGPLMKDRTCILVSHNVALTLTLADHVVVLENGRIVTQGVPADVVASGVLGTDELLINSIQNSREVSRVPSATNVTDKDAIQVAAPQNGGQQDSKEVEQKPKKKTNEELQQVGMVKFGVYASYIKSMGSTPYWALVIAALVFHQGAAIAQNWWVRVWSAAISSMESLVSTKNIVLTSAGVLSTVAHNLTSSASGLFEYTPEAAVRNVIVPLMPVGPPTTYVNVLDHEDGYLFVQESVNGPGYYLKIYGLIAIVYIFLSFFREALFYFGSLSASNGLFDKLLNSIMRAKPRFFDSTPVGRIINRFSKDIESIDREVAVDALSFIHSILSVGVIIGVISVIVPGFLLIGVVISIIFFLINMFYLQSSRELKRMQSVTRSPIYQHFGETLVGISTIRAYGYEQRFIAESMHKVDTNSRPYWIMWALNRWMCYRTDLSGGLVSFFAGVFVMMSQNSIDSGLAGLILTYAISFTENMFWVVLLYATNEMNMNSVERIDEFLAIEQEAPDVIPDHRPPPNWPTTGAISVTDLSLRYAPELPRVIKGISFDVDPCSKIGIVGRTGAGKSTIASAFFRFLEADTGKIVIDGIDISTIGLRDLRQSLAIIPQDPTLFTGTVRSNLDPFNNYSDHDVFTVLRHVHLINDIPGEEPEASGSSANSDGLADTEREARDMNIFYRLESPVTEGGGNLSQGQRQLMCLARSLLKSPKIILLDEATASIDYNTDAQIQETIRTEFANTTILTIAHRLRSIIDYDKILVLDSGFIKEYDHPHVLLQQQDSIFRSMCASSGELEALEDLAKQAYEKVK
ncbi:hypothetical protein V1525DRAFT_363124 [Lipomyces kononenkoae]|uniref:Uncharacterized protein n=1 Tax=Lipomyces kononenkoae TaxID=34357 RepID=A0ACC3SXB3_LIPKO